MKINKRDLSIVMIIVGVVALFLSYQFYFKGCLEDRETIKTETESLKAEYNELAAMMNKLQDYRNEIDSDISEMDSLVKTFPAMYLYEDGILYLNRLEEDVDTYAVTFDSYTITETAFEEPLTCTIGKKNGDEWTTQSATYLFGTSTISTTYTCTDYAKMKSLINSIYNERNDNMPKSVESVTMSFDNTTGKITGDMTINMYSLADGVNNSYSEPTVDGVELGLDTTSENACGIFGTWATPVEEEETEPTAE